MSRFLICSLIMKSYENDAFINDIDFSPNYKLDLIGQTLKNKKFDVGFYDENQVYRGQNLQLVVVILDTKVNFQIVF